MCFGGLSEKGGRRINKETTMKLLRFSALVLILSSAAYPQSAKLGMGAFSNESGAILMTVDAGLVNRTLDNPYVMFYVFMASKDEGKSISVAAKDVVLVYKGQEYLLPTVKDFRANYKGGIQDIERYRLLGKEGVIASWVRMYRFPGGPNFFPTIAPSSVLAADVGYMFGYYGFKTPLYFKNPGFAKGDKLTIKVRDSNNDQLTGECEVILN
jgi:hypothetical protein